MLIEVSGRYILTNFVVWTGAGTFGPKRWTNYRVGSFIFPPRVFVKPLAHTWFWLMRAYDRNNKVRRVFYYFVCQFFFFRASQSAPCWQATKPNASLTGIYHNGGIFQFQGSAHSRIRECIRSNSNQNYPRKPFPPFSFFFPKSTSALAISQGAHKPHFAYTAHRREEESKLERTTVPVCFFFFLCFFVISSTPLGFCRCKRIATK